MRYAKIALLTFGGGLVLGLAVVGFGIDPLARVASGLMAFGIAAIPPALAADLGLAVRQRLRPARRRRRSRAPSRRSAATPPHRRARPRKPAAPKR